MGPDLDTLATTLYVTADDLLIQHPHWAPERPAVGIAPRLSDAELVTLAVIGVLLRFDSEARFGRYAHAHLGPWFPYLPTRSAYNKRLRGSVRLLQHVIGWLARDSPSWWDDVWLVDSTPIECGRSRETQQRSDLGGWAEYGYSASHSRYFWGLRLHLIATPSGLPITFALAGAKADERDICSAMLSHAQIARDGQTIMADKGYRSADFEKQLKAALGSASSDPPPKQKHRGRASSSSKRYARPSNRYTTPSKTNSVSNATADACCRRLGCWPNRCLCTHTPTHTRPHHGHLAQPNHQPARPGPAAGGIGPARQRSLIAYDH